MISPFMDRKLYFKTVGVGNPLVLLHGFLESSKIWDPFLEELSQKRQVVCVDLPGHGKSENLLPVHSMDLMADAVTSVLKQLDIEKAFFAGHSMGGYVALAILEKSPELVKGLMLINSTPEEDSPERKENTERAVELVKKNKRAYVLMAISNLLSPENKEEFRSEIGEIKQEAQRLNTKGIIAALKGMKIRTNMQNVLQEAKISKLIISGIMDPVLDPEHLEVVAKSTGCDFKLLPGGHLSFIESQEELRKMLHFID